MLTCRHIVRGIKELHEGAHIFRHMKYRPLAQCTHDSDLYEGGIAIVPLVSAENIDPGVLLGTTLRRPMSANHRCRCARAMAGASDSSATYDVKLERGSVDGRKLISSLHSDSASVFTRRVFEVAYELAYESERDGTPAVWWATLQYYLALKIHDGWMLTGVTRAKRLHNRRQTLSIRCAPTLNIYGQA